MDLKNLQTLPLSMLVLIALGCANKGTGGGVKMDLFMTGSAQPATVAMNPVEKIFSFFLPRAVALTPPSMSDSQARSVSLTSAWVSMEAIEFEATETHGESESDGDEVELQGPFYVDLLSINPMSLGQADLSTSELRRIKMKLHVEDSISSEINAPSGLNGNSIFLSGMVGSAAFTYSSNDSAELEIGGPNALNPDESKDLLVAIRLADMIKKIDLGAVTDGVAISESHRVSATNPCPLIDAGASDLYTCFRKGIQSESDFGEDSGDHDLDMSDLSVK